MSNQQPALTLYVYKGSCTIAAHSLLAHIGVPYKIVILQNGPGGNSTNSRIQAADGSLTYEDFLKINPKGYVPVLTIGEGSAREVLTELPAILTYGALLAPDLNLLGTGVLGRARVAEWLAWASGTIHTLGFAGFWRPGRFADDSNPTTMKDIQNRAEKTIVGAFAQIEEKLKGCEWAVGDALTVVDFNLYVYWTWWITERPDGEVAAQHPNYARLVAKLGNPESLTLEATITYHTPQKRRIAIFIEKAAKSLVDRAAQSWVSMGYPPVPTAHR
ncbi:unnamed protein product [Parascedosporium putredinis]|uniref:Glutathione S-transferase n=1 Tax=Parascedosporium putredinis TaxID=1442378 RepID=A0A9P1MEG6_9PEZI|nr:unnamed protein product [Parascedosporium putredinis]CAI8002618.1 unnamed protein product [Parascedosporium putredinis]